MPLWLLAKKIHFTVLLIKIQAYSWITFTACQCYVIAPSPPFVSLNIIWALVVQYTTSFVCNIQIQTFRLLMSRCVLLTSWTTPSSKHSIPALYSSLLLCSWTSEASGLSWWSYLFMMCVCVCVCVCVWGGGGVWPYYLNPNSSGISSVGEVPHWGLDTSRHKESVKRSHNYDQRQSYCVHFIAECALRISERWGTLSITSHDESCDHFTVFSFKPNVQFGSMFML